MIAAAHRLKEEGLAEPVLVTAETAGHSPRLPDYTGIYYQRRKSKGVTEETANEIARKPLYFAALMVAAGDADAMVGGSVFTTAETVRAALGAIGPAPGVETVSGAFLMIHHDARFGYEGAMTFADCAVVIDPSPTQLAEIAISAAATTRQVLETEPIVALLSFSTKGSARHSEVDKVTAALRLIGELEPGLESGWRTSIRRRDYSANRRLKSARIGCGRACQYGRISEPCSGKHRIQDRGASGRSGSDRAFVAGYGETGQRSVARVHGRGHLLHVGVTACQG